MKLEAAWSNTRAQKTPKGGLMMGGYMLLNLVGVGCLGATLTIVRRPLKE